MKVAIACLCLCLVAASNAFPLFGGDMMRTMMFSNMMAGRPMFDFNNLFGAPSPNAQQQLAQDAQAQGVAVQDTAAQTMQSGAQQGAAANSGGLFGNMNPILGFSLLGEGMGF